MLYTVLLHTRTLIYHNRGDLLLGVLKAWVSLLQSYHRSVVIFGHLRGCELASNQTLPSHARNIISACKEGESLKDFDHVLDVVGCGYQLAVNFAHTVTTHGRQRLDQ